MPVEDRSVGRPAGRQAAAIGVGAMEGSGIFALLEAAVVRVGGPA
jgi:hypothetical protein